MKQKEPMEKFFARAIFEESILNSLLLPQIPSFTDFFRIDEVPEDMDEIEKLLLDAANRLGW
jgi:hypothetical protein